MNAAYIHRLPPELLGMIFVEYCCDYSQKACIKRNYPQTLEEIPPLAREEVARLSQEHLGILSLVCRLWGRIVFAMPMLWKTVTLDTGFWVHTNRRATTLLSLISASLERSGQCPLTLRIHAHADLVDGGETTDAALRLLIAHANRWQDVTLDVCGEFLPALTSLEGQPFPVLHRISLPGHVPELQRLFNVTQMPRLRQLSLAGHVLNNFTGEHPNLPWTSPSLVDLFYSGVYSIETLAVLVTVPPTCETATYRVVTWTPFPSIPAIVSCPVRSLTLSLAPVRGQSLQHEPGRIFDSLILPNLQQLTWHSLESQPAPIWPHQSFLACADRSSFSTTLTALHIKAYASTDELMQVFAVLPCLEKLVLEDIVAFPQGDRRVPARFEEHPAHTVITDALLLRLAGWSGRSAEDAPRPLPLARLREVRFITVLACSNEALAAFITSRASTNGQVKILPLPNAVRVIGPDDVKMLMSVLRWMYTAMGARRRSRSMRPRKIKLTLEISNFLAVFSVFIG
ncbi:hypothetical protein C8F01DRAFT_1243013 [Mycena amicta]|nr:hypothetical protein C8F01DRAFT_1243013 [Mycena amicta]